MSCNVTLWVNTGVYFNSALWGKIVPLGFFFQWSLFGFLESDITAYSDETKRTFIFKKKKKKKKVFIYRYDFHNIVRYLK